MNTTEQTSWTYKFALGAVSGILLGLVVTLIFSVGMVFQFQFSTNNTSPEIVLSTFIVFVQNNFFYFSTPLSIVIWLSTTFTLSKRGLVDQAPLRGIAIGGLLGFFYPLAMAHQPIQLPAVQFTDLFTIFTICFLACCTAGKVSGNYLRARLTLA